MDNLWYGSDEVKVFHPIVEKCVGEALIRSNLNTKYKLKHHHGAFTTGIPDFALVDLITEDIVCIIEVKKTPSDVFGQKAGYQSKTYVEQLYPLKWKIGFHPNFCVTNIEHTQFYSLRDGTSLIGCLLEKSPKYAEAIDSDNLTEKFIEILEEYFVFLDSKQQPTFSMYLETISESFNKSFYNVSQILGTNFNRISRLVMANEAIKQSILYELFRFAFYYYIKEYYLLSKSELSEYFEDFETEKISSTELVNSIKNNFNRAMEIDFIDILKNYDSPNTLFPNELLANEELGKIFNNYIITLEKNAHEGLEKNVGLLNYVSLITSDIYNKEEMHATGKIMSDEILSDVLSGFTINECDDKIIDPCCGDGNLLVSSYKYKNKIAKLKNINISHNDLLKTLYGIDIDPNLIQLAAFKLIGQNFEDVDNTTRTNFKNADFLNMENIGKYDSVIMNPPYLRNEDLSSSKKEEWLLNIESNTGERSFIREVAQPNMYYFFVEKATQLIDVRGSGAFILMSKFLNNKDGALLKKYLIPFLDAIIHYPHSFFEGFWVTTNIFILKNKSNAPDKISFLNIKNTEVLKNVDDLKKVIDKKEDIINVDYSIINVDKITINHDSNWRLYLIDPINQFDKFETAHGLKTIKSIFKNIRRGSAGNSGGSSNIFLNSSNNDLAEQTGEIESEYLGFGLLRNNIPSGRRKFILTEDCLNFSTGLLIPNNLKNNLSDDNIRGLKPGIKKYILEIKNILGSIKAQKVISESINSKVIPEIIIPRGDRIKHTVFYYPFIDKEVVLSTNFFSLTGLRNLDDPESEKKIMFICAFLVSTLGQIQFEIHGNNQEGSRKLEKFIIEKFKVLDPENIDKSDIEDVIKEFSALNDVDLDFLGNESRNIRDALDSSIFRILFKKDNLGFSTVTEMKEYFQGFLEELIINRIAL